MNLSRVLVLLAGLLFVGFLISPGFVDCVRGDGTVIMLPGYAALLWHLLNAPSYFSIEGLSYVPIPLVDIALFVLPVLYCCGGFERPSVRLLFGVFFLFGTLSIACLIWHSENTAFGAYLWLLSAVAAAGSCVLTPQKKLPNNAVEPTRALSGARGSP